ncbi:MAG TPA: hypothetical protein VMG10_18130 [Gemmataceae bacterium]|nr:hypothetical protein [Gemmataceae bacterium]
MNFNTDGLIGTIDIGTRDKESWRQCAVAVRADGFSAEYVCSVRDEELRRFLLQLETALSQLGQPSTIRFRALECGFAFEMALDRRGHVEGNYEFGRDWRGPFLSGSFSADQTHLRAWAQDLRTVLAS